MICVKKIFDARFISTKYNELLKVSRNKVREEGYVGKELEQVLMKENDPLAC